MFPFSIQENFCKRSKTQQKVPELKLLIHSVIRMYVRIFNNKLCLPNYLKTFSMSMKYYVYVAVTYPTYSTHDVTCSFLCTKIFLKHFYV